jgi:mannonate dehydratase
VTHAVSILPYEPPDATRNAPQSWERSHGAVDLADVARTASGAYPWEYESLKTMRDTFAAAGLQLSVIESSPPMEKVRLGLPGRDEEIELIGTMLRAMGRLGIGVWCYNFLAVASWGRTSVATPTRGGALVTAFNLADVPPLNLPDGITLTHNQLWDNLSYFLQKVLPVAEAAGVKLALHPDDPPLPQIKNLPRIINSVEAFERVFDLAPSPANALTLCQGNFALMTGDLPGVIKHFGSQDKIAFVHFRDVRGRADHFEETFHDIGQTDMLACLRAYQSIGFEGVLRPDHVPTLAGEINTSPGYETLGRLFAVGYIRGLSEAVYGRMPLAQQGT